MPEAARQNFQPQVGDTSKGPIQHTYIPRSDNPGDPVIIVNGQHYAPIGYIPNQPIVQTPQLYYSNCAFYPTYTGVTQSVQFGSMPYPGLYSQAPLYTQQAIMMNHSLQPMPNYQPQPHAGQPLVQQPVFGTMGMTGSEVLNQQLLTAEGLRMNAKQDMKPADDDTLRVYWVRELDNTWTQRNRITIDSPEFGSTRWYTIDGVFYAVRLPDQ